MLKQILSTLLISLTLASIASATVCDDYPNPCIKSQECSAKSDFVFEVLVTYLDEVDVIVPDYGKGGSQIAKQKTARLNIEKWIKGERQHEPTQISFPIDKWYCSEIKPIFPELAVNKRYRVYGVHYRSENYCLAYYSKDSQELLSELTSCKTSTRTEGRYYWLIEVVD